MRELDNIPVAKNCSGYHPACHFLPISGIPIVRVGETIWTPPPFSVMAFHIGLVHCD